MRPDWTDGRGLLGYHNPVTDEYVETPFLRALRAAAREEDLARRERRSPRPYFVILDEMNLARVEHYFSDFLSVLESDGVLHLHSRSAMERAGQRGDPVPGSLAISRNLFFTGTVNVDETTHMCSPKVLDRAFTLELGEVDLDEWGARAEVRTTLDHGLPLRAMDRTLTLGRRPGVEEWTELGKVAGSLPFSLGVGPLLPLKASAGERGRVRYHAFLYLRHILSDEAPLDDRLLPPLAEPPSGGASSAPPRRFPPAGGGEGRGPPL